MASTEIRNALQLVRDAEDCVNAALDEAGKTDNERQILTNLADSLRDLDTFLVKIDLNAHIGELADKAKNLDSLNKQTQQSLKKLENIAKAVNTAAKAIDALVKGFGILVKAGLV